MSSHHPVSYNIFFVELYPQFVYKNALKRAERAGEKKNMQFVDNSVSKNLGCALGEFDP